MANLRYAPELSVRVDGDRLPAAMRASMASVTFQTGFDSADRVEVTLVNEQLRWLDHPLLALDRTLSLSLGYAPDPLRQVFVGDIVGQAMTLPAGGSPTLTVVAQDRRQRLQQGTKVRWFAVPVQCHGTFPIPDLAVAGLVAAEHGLLPIFEPIGAALSVLIGGAQIVVGLGDADEMQKIIRKQTSESDFDFLTRVARENGWEMVIDHSGPRGGEQLRFLSLADHLTAELALKYGESLMDFAPRVSTVGQIAAVSVRLWRPEIKMEFTITVSWDWDRSSLNLRIVPGYGMPGGAEGTPEGLAASILRGGREQAANEPERAGAITRQSERQAAAARQRGEQELATASTEGAMTLVDEPVSLITAPRIIAGKLIPRLNARLTASGTTVGDPRIGAGTVMRIEGVGERFGGLYRVTSATHTLDGSGYRTAFEARKELWFGSIPLVEQGAVRVRINDFAIA